MTQLKPQKRYIYPAILEFMQKRMVFVGGPRQVGKTTLCLAFLKEARASSEAYLNWDDLESRKILKAGHLPSQKVLLFDEIHKFKDWRNLIKGFYDKQKSQHQFLVTGSARLDIYRRGGDSLLGRYRYLNLHPLSVPELGLNSKSDLETLLKFGGFPEPFFMASEKEWRLWQRERLYRVVNDDIRDLEQLREYSSIELLAEELPRRVASPLSIKSLGEDLKVNPRTVEKWVQILEKVYYCFRILPFGAPRIRAVKKEKKLYLWDWSSIDSDGAKFENFVASHLLKYCDFIQDTEGHRMELRFLRDTDKREVDFVVLKDKQAIFAVECKTGQDHVSPHIRYFKERCSIKKFYQVHLGTKDYQTQDGVRVLPFHTFCQEVGLK